MSEAAAYPLTWPAGWRRTARDARKRGHFNHQRADLTVDRATRRVIDELARIGVDASAADVTISTNLVLRRDGWPRSDQRAPADPGAAVYWQVGKRKRCIAVDRYDRIADNLAAIAATLEAMRAIDRHGGAEILERAFTGFTALPAPEQWWNVLGFPSSTGVTLADVDERYRTLAMQRHPDRGGKPGEMSSLNWARDAAHEFLVRAP